MIQKGYINTGIGLSAAALVLLVGFAFRSSRETKIPESPTESAAIPLPARIEPDPIDLGVLRPGERAGVAASVANLLDGPLIIEKFETSCPCVRVSMDSQLPVTLSPKSTLALRIGFDPTEEPDFRGHLAVSLEGRSSDSQCACRARVLVSVTAEPGSTR
jgi:hypothetical protein